MIVSFPALLPVIRKALESDQHVRMTVNGTSMLPFIHDGDTIELEPLLCRRPKLGDILLAEGQGGRFVIHRVVRIIGSMLYLRGDAQICDDGPYDQSAVLGKIITSCRQGQLRTHESGTWRFAGLVWLFFSPLANRLIWWLRRLRRLGRHV